MQEHLLDKNKRTACANAVPIGGETGIRTLAACYSATPLAGEPLNRLGTSPDKSSLGGNLSFVKFCSPPQPELIGYDNFTMLGLKAGFAGTPIKSQTVAANDYLSVCYAERKIARRRIRVN